MGDTFHYIDKNKTYREIHGRQTSAITTRWPRQLHALMTTTWPKPRLYPRTTSKLKFSAESLHWKAPRLYR